MATRSQFDLKIAIRLVAVPLATATATATHLKIQLWANGDICPRFWPTFAIDVIVEGMRKGRALNKTTILTF